jgi:hypothetical protein
MSWYLVKHRDSDDDKCLFNLYLGANKPKRQRRCFLACQRIHAVRFSVIFPKNAVDIRQKASVVELVLHVCGRNQ